MTNEIVGYVSPLGYLHCPTCASSVDEPIALRTLDPNGEPCDGCSTMIGKSDRANLPYARVSDSGPSAANWEYQVNELPIRIPFSIKVF